MKVICRIARTGGKKWAISPGACMVITLLFTFIVEFRECDWGQFLRWYVNKVPGPLCKKRKSYAPTVASKHFPP